MLSALGSSSINVALPALSETFHTSFQAVQWVVLSYLLALTTLIISVGRLGDLLGRRRLLLGGIVLFTLAALAAGLAPGMPMLIAARALQGLGAAIMMSLSLAYAGELVSRESVGSAMGLLGTMSAVGTALGPSLGGFLLAGPGWRSLFLLNLPLGLAAFYLILRNLPNDSVASGAGRREFDFAGSVLLVLTLGAYTLSMTIGRGVFDWRSIGLLALALLGGFAFILLQGRTAAPLIRLAAFKDIELSAGLAMSLLVSTVLMASLVVGPFYLSLALRLKPEIVGLLMSVGPLVVALTGIPAGQLADRLGAARMTRIGLSGVGAGAIALAVLPLRLGAAGYLGSILLLTLGYALFQTANNAAVMTAAGPEQRGVTSGLLNLSRSLGLITGTAVIGALFAAAVDGDVSKASAAALTHGLHLSFSLAAGLIGLAFAVALVASHRSIQQLRG